MKYILSLAVLALTSVSSYKLDLAKSIRGEASKYLSEKLEKDFMIQPLGISGNITLNETVIFYDGLNCVDSVDERGFNVTICTGELITGEFAYDYWRSTVKGRDENYTYLTELVHTNGTNNFESFSSYNEQTGNLDSSFYSFFIYNDTRGIKENITTTYDALLQQWDQVGYWSDLETTIVQTYHQLPGLIQYVYLHQHLDGTWFQYQYDVKDGIYKNYHFEYQNMVTGAFENDQVHFFPKGRVELYNVRLADGRWVQKEVYHLEAFGTFINYQDGTGKCYRKTCDVMGECTQVDCYSLPSPSLQKFLY